MQNHSCPIAKYCTDYRDDRCQGCQARIKEAAASTDRYWPTTKNPKVEEFKNYLKKDIEFAMDMMRQTRKPANKTTLPGIVKVHFNDPATVVLWADGTKTVVKCQDGDLYSKETGLAMCIAKKVLGNKGNFNQFFKKYISDYDKRDTVTVLVTEEENECPTN